MVVIFESKYFKREVDRGKSFFLILILDVRKYYFCCSYFVLFRCKGRERDFIF